jgi:LAGLIDADG endonuclease.
MARSENASRADNQQESLAKSEFVGWVVGFVDGEGCFSINFLRQPDRKEKTRTRRGYTTGYQIFHEFAVTQGMSSKKALESIRDFFGVGGLYLNTRYDNHNEHLYRYVVRKRADLLQTIIPFFERHELRTKKRSDFKKFVRCMHTIEKGKHLKVKGLISVAHIASTMNRKKNGKILARILRDHASNIPRG